jgi:hypothetical protein
MPDQHTDRPEPTGDQVSDSSVSEGSVREDSVIEDRVIEDVAALSDLIAAGVEVDGEVQVTESTWVVYGHTSYDGETIVGEYHDEVEATEVYRAVLRPDPDPERDRPAR